MSTEENIEPIVSQIHDYWLDINNRELWIHGVDVSGVGYDGDEPGVDYLMANMVIKNLHILRKHSKTKPVKIHLNTCGGAYEEGMAIYDAIKMMPYKVMMINYTHAQSMSSIIFQSADVRIMLPHSYFMFHYGTLGVGPAENKSVYSTIDFCKTFDECMLDIYVDKVRKAKKFKGWTKKKIRKFLNEEMEKKADVYLNAEETVAWGFADKVLYNWEDVFSIKI